MKLEFILLSGRVRTPTLTVHKTGKLGFNTSAIKTLSIDRNAFFKVAKDEHGALYLLKTKDAEEAIKARKAGEYYYLENPLFKELGFVAKTVFSLEKVDHEGNTYYKLNKKA